MPRISEFYGIFIYMYFTDHAPPHFHAIYAQYEAEVEISSGMILMGSFASPDLVSGDRMGTALSARTPAKLGAS